LLTKSPGSFRAASIVSKNATYPAAIGPMINPILPAAAWRRFPLSFWSALLVVSADPAGRFARRVSLRSCFNIQ
jgi:hypothetical protein